jgi:mannose-6-phosphate isomerase
VKPEPFRIEPIFTPRIWGARSLAPLFPEKTSLQEPIGEVWLTGVDCKVASGPFAGKTLGEAWREMPAEWRGTRFTEAGDFPILIKFIFPKDKLSIQVHPDDAYAAAHEQAAGGRGKTEMWHVVSAEPGAKVLVGLKPGVNKEAFLKALASHTLEELFEAHAVRAGDTFFVPARTPHTIGPNMVICEVQEYSDLTYRVYDYGRVDSQGKSRELHIEKAMDVINFERSGDGKVDPLQIPTPEGTRFLLAACQYFATERHNLNEPQTWWSQEDRFELIIFLSGAGGLAWSGDHRSYGASECWLVPACLPSIELRPDGFTSAMRVYAPDLESMSDQLQAARQVKRDLPWVIFE